MNGNQSCSSMYAIKSLRLVSGYFRASLMSVSELVQSFCRACDVFSGFRFKTIEYNLQSKRQISPVIQRGNMSAMSSRWSKSFSQMKIYGIFYYFKILLIFPSYSQGCHVCSASHLIIGKPFITNFQLTSCYQLRISRSSAEKTSPCLNPMASKYEIKLFLIKSTSLYFNESLLSYVRGLPSLGLPVFNLKSYSDARVEEFSKGFGRSSDQKSEDVGSYGKACWDDLLSFYLAISDYFLTIFYYFIIMPPEKEPNERKITLQFPQFKINISKIISIFYKWQLFSPRSRDDSFKSFHTRIPQPAGTIPTASKSKTPRFCTLNARGNLRSCLIFRSIGSEVRNLRGFHFSRRVSNRSCLSI